VEYGGNSKERNAGQRPGSEAENAPKLRRAKKRRRKNVAKNLEEQNQTTARSTTAWILGEWGREITGK